jgi:hypothetical protein
MSNDPGPVANCTTASSFNALKISFVIAYTHATVRFGLPSGIGPVLKPNIFNSLTIFPTDTIVDKPGLFIRAQASNGLGNCSTGGLELEKYSLIVSHI